jgi:hypothetical protein
METSNDIATILAMCERFGYGRVMQIASEAWQEKDPDGALTIGPAAGLRTTARPQWITSFNCRNDRHEACGYSATAGDWRCQCDCHRIRECTCGAPPNSIHEPIRDLMQTPEKWEMLASTEFQFLGGGPVWPIVTENGRWIAVAETRETALDIITEHNGNTR